MIRRPPRSTRTVTHLPYTTLFRSSIAEATKPFTPNGRGLAESTILRNPACRDLYMKEAQPVRRQRRLKRTLTAVLENGPTESEASRMRYLMRGTKEELAVQLIQAERRLQTSNSANALLRNTMLKKELGSLKNDKKKSVKKKNSRG